MVTKNFGSACIGRYINFRQQFVERRHNKCADRPGLMLVSTLPTVVMS